MYLSKRQLVQMNFRGTQLTWPFLVDFHVLSRNQGDALEAEASE